MNPQAIALYRSHGIDLARDRLEIAVCAQHHNGGLAVDAHWQTSVEGLYAAGESAGTFGAARPGGSALNSGQVGSQRAAEHIAFLAARREPGRGPGPGGGAALLRGDGRAHRPERAAARADPRLDAAGR